MNTYISRQFINYLTPLDTIGLMTFWRRYISLTTVNLGYNEQLVTDQICSL